MDLVDFALQRWRAKVMILLNSGLDVLVCLRRHLSLLQLLCRPGATTLTLTPKAITDQDPVECVPQEELWKGRSLIYNLTLFRAFCYAMCHAEGHSLPSCRGCFASSAWTGKAAQARSSFRQFKVSRVAVNNCEGISFRAAQMRKPCRFLLSF